MARFVVDEDRLVEGTERILRQKDRVGTIHGAERSRGRVRSAAAQTECTGDDVAAHDFLAQHFQLRNDSQQELIRRLSAQQTLVTVNW